MPEPRRQPPAARTRFTGRAAVLAVVICAIALSLAYPVREYIAQRRQIDQLQAQQLAMLVQLHSLQREQQRLNDPAYIEQLARDRLHFCLPAETCYVIIGAGPGPGGRGSPGGAVIPWYERLWNSIRQADQGVPGSQGTPGKPRGGSR